LIPLSLYIHIPWCVRKCPYCDFNSHALRDELPEEGYVAALLADLESDLPRIWGRRIHSIFIGGGTPSLFSPAALDNLFSGLRARLPITADCEITLEANPGTVEQGRFREFRAIGINRLSMGIQSFNDEALQELGRIHNAAEAMKAIEVARAAGFDNINLDIMFGLPGQTPELGLSDLTTAMSFDPEHLSWYQLTIEPNTLFHSHPPILPGEEDIDELFAQGQTLLAEEGFHQYEVSAYAHNGRQCRHNLNYWEYGDYLGIGAGAHAKLSDPASGAITRYERHRQPQQYMETALNGRAISKERIVTQQEKLFEFMLNALRLTEGFDLSLFEERTGLKRDIILPQGSELSEMGLLSVEGHRLVPSEQGRRFLNEMTERFLPEDD
jgi:putative oxygen-independent coproporphyrinogen III oxidase